MSEIPTIEQIEREAAKRGRLHKKHKSRRALSDNYEFVGLCGEREFAIMFDLPMDLRLRPKGDGGIDFVLEDGRTVDVKTFRKAYNLLVEKSKASRCADILVLAQFHEGDDVELLGWATKDEIHAAPVKDFGYGVESHYISCRALREMEDLDE